MSNDITVNEKNQAEVIKSLVLDGNIGKMSPDQKVQYYRHLCQSLGLNELTQPVQVLMLQGKETLYATKSATEQLRQIHGVSVDRIDQKIDRDICITTVTVRDKHGRLDGATGAVNIAGLKGDALANAMMKSETKAKRRATLSICGLGMLDESEIETIPGARAESVHSEPVQIPQSIAPSITAAASPEMDDFIQRFMAAHEMADAKGKSAIMREAKSTFDGEQLKMFVAQVNKIK